MSVFEMTGNKKRDYWLKDGECDWVTIPAGVIEHDGFRDLDLPIRLHVGDASWGERHISRKHNAWLKKNEKTAPEMLDFKLRQSGTIYCTEDDEKIKIFLSLLPGSLLVLRLSGNSSQQYLSVVTMYNYSGRTLDGSRIGRYRNFTA